jgi:hypothetical protein
LKYQTTSAIGNAGEYYFAYWISKEFQWPCRLLDIDVGIDAQIEILDIENNTTGDFLAIQIKTSIDEKISKSISLANLEYWKSVQDIVMLISINLTNLKIYWKVVNDSDIDILISEAKLKSNNTVTIKLDENNLLKKNDINLFRVLRYKDNIIKLNTSLEFIFKNCTEINNDYWDDEYDQYQFNSNADIISVNCVIEQYDAICKTYEELQINIDKNPGIEKHLNMININEVLERTEEILDCLIDDVCSDPETRYELKEQYQTSDYHITIMRMFEAKF